MTGSKPVALPLGYAPFGSRKIGGFKSYRNRFQLNLARYRKKHSCKSILMGC
jgi:hypothetical protein